MRLPLVPEATFFFPFPSSYDGRPGYPIRLLPDQAMSPPFSRRSCFLFPVPSLGRCWVRCLSEDPDRPSWPRPLPSMLFLAISFSPKILDFFPGHCRSLYPNGFLARHMPEVFSTARFAISPSPPQPEASPLFGSVEIFVPRMLPGKPVFPWIPSPAPTFLVLKFFFTRSPPFWEDSPLSLSRSTSHCINPSRPQAALPCTFFHCRSIPYRENPQTKVFMAPQNCPLMACRVPWTGGWPWTSKPFRYQANQ